MRLICGAEVGKQPEISAEVWEELWDGWVLTVLLPELMGDSSKPRWGTALGLFFVVLNFLRMLSLHSYNTVEFLKLETTSKIPKSSGSPPPPCPPTVSPSATSLWFWNISRDGGPPPELTLLTLLMLSGGRDASWSALRHKNKKRDGVKMQTAASGYFYG